jgi:hypothetical protein
MARGVGFSCVGSKRPVHPTSNSPSVIRRLAAFVNPLITWVKFVNISLNSHLQYEGFRWSGEVRHLGRQTSRVFAGVRRNTVSMIEEVIPDSLMKKSANSPSGRE